MKWCFENWFTQTLRSLKNKGADESCIKNLEWGKEQLMEFIHELRDRKAEGETVIDEFLDVLCIDIAKEVT